MKNIAIIFAGGFGKRMGGTIPKQFLPVRGKPLLAYTLEHFQRHEEVDGIILVALSEWIAFCKKMDADLGFDKVAAVVAGGSSSQASIYIGLETAREIYGEDVIALIHDGVRPLIDAKTISDCIAGVCLHGSAVTVSPQMETIMYGETAVGACHILDRDRCQVARAPQCFYLRDILQAHQNAEDDHRLRFVDSAELMEYYGHTLYPVRGPLDNIKITTVFDLQIFRTIVESRERGEYPGP